MSGVRDRDRDRILKDANGNLKDHLRNHIHLTNCIHLKNHMHKTSPMVTDRSLIRDLVALQRSRSLRDPSMSPPQFQSSPAPDHDPDPDPLPKRVEKDGGRRSLGLSANLSSNVGLGDEIHKRIKKEESSRRSFKDDSRLDAATLASDIYPESSGIKHKQKGRESKQDDHSHGGIEVESTLHSHGLNRVKRRKVRTGKRVSRAPITETSMASNFVSQIDYDSQQKVNAGPSSSYGIPFNWSRMHDRGKSFLNSRSDHSASSTNSESLPLLINGSQESYSGELDLYKNKFLTSEPDSDLASEAHSGHRTRSRSRHQSLTQKYAPKTFRDLVGQNLAVQALSNAVSKQKIGLLYIFYGPHGTGKTSCARIFARALTCQSSDHPKPCGFCSSCVEHDAGKNRAVLEVGPVNNLGYKSIMKLMENMIGSRLHSRYRVFIIDDCDTLPPDCWSAIVKVIDRAPRRMVFVLVNSSLDVLPHIIVSRCHKFFFPKLKDGDIIYTLQWIASKEGFEIDKDALKLIASRSNGSLRDAEMTLEQLSLLGQRISVSLVQELVGLISDDKLVDLLDLALSADTVNTVKHLREIMESGVEPLALMSQLATVVTDILAGSYIYMKARSKRKFFRQQALSKDDMEKLRLALKTLSEAEKQLRMSNDKLTWLTAALLQLAPDQQYVLPTSSMDGSRKSNFGHGETSGVQRGASSSGAHKKTKEGLYQHEIEKIWSAVIENIQINSVKEFLYHEGKLTSLSFGSAPTAQLTFTSHINKSKAEKIKPHIVKAFEDVLGSSVTIEIVSEMSQQDPYAERSEIIEVEASSSREPKARMHDHRPEATSSHKSSSVGLQRRLGEQSQSKSLVKGKVSLADILQQAESKRNGWSTRKAFSIAEKLEQENLRMEPRSRSLLCWKASRVTRRKVSRLKTRPRKSRTLVRFAWCGRCISSRSPR